MKHIILNKKKTNSIKVRKQQKVPIKIILKDKKDIIKVPTELNKKNIITPIKNELDVKKIILKQKIKCSRVKSKIKTKPNNYLTHKVNNINCNDQFKIKHLKNNQNIKYFKNLPESKDIFVCSILSENFNIIKY